MPQILICFFSWKNCELVKSSVCLLKTIKQQLCTPPLHAWLQWRISDTLFHFGRNVNNFTTDVLYKDKACYLHCDIFVWVLHPRFCLIPSGKASLDPFSLLKQRLFFYGFKSKFSIFCGQKNTTPAFFADWLLFCYTGIHIVPLQWFRVLNIFHLFLLLGLRVYPKTFILCSSVLFG